MVQTLICLGSSSTGCLGAKRLTAGSGSNSGSAIERYRWRGTDAGWSGLARMTPPSVGDLPDSPGFLMCPIWSPAWTRRCAMWSKDLC